VATDFYSMSQGGKGTEVTGSPTEKAILSWGLQLGMKFNETRSKSAILQVFPFNSEKKRGGVAVQVVIHFICSNVSFAFG